MHKLRLSVYGYQTDQPLVFGIYAGHTIAYPQLLDLVKVLEAPPGKPAVLETEIYLRTAPDSDLQISDHFRLVPFGIGVQVPKNSLAKDCKGPGLAIQWVDVEEPAFPLPGDRWLSADIPAELLEKIRLGDTQATLANLPSGTREVFLAALEKTLQRIGPALYRRPLTDAELAGAVARVARQIDDGRSLREALLGEVAQMMTAPDFLCVIERPGRLNDFALASRLAYFLWNSTPDAALSRWPGKTGSAIRPCSVTRPSGCSPIRSRSDLSTTSSTSGSDCGRLATPRPTWTCIPSTTTCSRSPACWRPRPRCAACSTAI